MRRLLSLIFTLLALCSVCVKDPAQSSSSSPTVTNLSLKIAAATLQFDRIVRDINGVLNAVLKRIDSDPITVGSSSARLALTDLHAEVAELERQSGRLVRDDFGKEFMKIYQSGASNLQLFIRSENIRLSSLFTLAARCDDHYQAVLGEMGSSSSKSSRDRDAPSFWDALIEGHWRLLAIAMLTCFLFYPWRTAVVHSVLFFLLYALVMQYLQLVDSTAQHFFGEFARFKDLGLGTFWRGLRDSFHFMKTASVNSAVCAIAPSLRSLGEMRVTISRDFDVLVKGVNVSLRRERRILSYIQSAPSPADYDRQRVVNLMRQNPFLIPRMHFADLRQRSGDDAAIGDVVRATDRLQAKAIDASDFVYDILSGGLESILTAEAVINQARLFTAQDKFADAAELASIVAGKYAQLEAAFAAVLDQLRQVQAEYEAVQSARNRITSKYQRKKITSGLALTASVAAIVSGVSLPLIGTIGTAAIGTATAGSATVALLTSENILTELHQFATDLGGFREALSKVRQTVIGSQHQLGSVADLLYLIQDDLGQLGLEYEPIDARVKDGLELFFKQALQEQTELIALLNIAPAKKQPKLDLVT